MSRKQKTFAPRSVHRKTNAHDSQTAEEEFYEEITEQDVKTPIPKDEFSSLSYEGFKNRAFQKINNDEAVVETYDKGSHIITIKKALLELGYTVSNESDFFDQTTKHPVAQFRIDHGMMGIAKIDAPMLKVMDKMLGGVESTESKKEVDEILEEEQIIHTEDSKLTQSNSKEEDSSDTDISKTPDPDKQILLSVGLVPTTINSQQALFDFFDMKVYGKITGQGWIIPVGYDYTNYTGKKVNVKVYISSLKKGWELTDAQWEDMKNRATAETKDATVFRKSVENYLAKVENRTSAIHEREILETKLYGLEELYNDYQMYFDSVEASAFNNAMATSSSSSMGSIDLSPLTLHPQWREKLDKSAQKHGFKDVTDFGNTINSYEEAFKGEAQNMLKDYLQFYEHTLFEEEKKLTNDAHVTALFEQLNGAEIQNENNKLNALKNDPNRYSTLIMDVAMSVETIDNNAKAIKEQQQQLKKTIEELNTPLVKDTDQSTENDIDYERLAQAKNKAEMKSIFVGYINKKRKALQTTREDITTHPNNIYELKDLIAVAYEQQGISQGSIQDLIIQEKISEINKLKILLGITLAIVSIAIVVATWGAATPIVAAGAALSLGISAYGVYEALEDYKRQDAAHEISLLQDDPSLVWVVVAIAGAALDVAALGAVFKSAKPLVAAAKAFNETGDVLTLQTTLAKMEGISTKIQASMVKQAKLNNAAKVVHQDFKLAMATTNMGINPAALPKLIELASINVKRGITTFKKFLAELELQKIIKSANDLTDDELKILKEAYVIAKKEINYLSKFVKLNTNIRKPIEFGGDLMKRPNVDLYILGRTKGAKITGGKGSYAGTMNITELDDVKVLRQPIPKHIEVKYPNSLVDQTKAYWKEINGPWLDDAIESGADIRFIQDPRLKQNQIHVVSKKQQKNFPELFGNIKEHKTYLYFEYQYLLKNGYKLLENGLMIKN